MNPIYYLAYALIKSRHYMLASELLEPYTAEIMKHDHSNLKGMKPIFIVEKLVSNEISDYSYSRFGSCHHI